MLKYRQGELGDKAPKALVLGMTSRRNLCIHPRVCSYDGGKSGGKEAQRSEMSDE